MAIHDFFKTKLDATIAIWEINESLDCLEEKTALDLLQSPTYKKLKTEKRKKEWLATRLLLAFVFKTEPVTIFYNEDRKPFLSNNKSISISHSGNYVVIMLHRTKSVGIDIQVFKKNIFKGSSLFMTTDELSEVGEKNQLSKLHVYWCAKEALFKYAGEYNLNLFSDFYIHPFNLNENNVLGEVISTAEKINLKSIITENYYLVFTA